MPIIAMTANAFSEDVTNAIKAGMNYHLAEYDLPIYEHKDGLRVVPSCLDLSAVETAVSYTHLDVYKRQSCTFPGIHP